MPSSKICITKRSNMINMSGIREFRSWSNLVNRNKSKSWFRRGLERILVDPLKRVVLAGGIMAGAFSQGVEAQNPPIFYGMQNFDPSTQNNVLSGGRVHFNYYGSGDANGDGVLDWADYSAMQQGISNDRTDLNGDGVTNSADLILMNNFLNGQTKYLPAHWDLLQTSSERIFWTNKALAIDSTNFHSPGPNWDCTQYADQTMINLDGVEKIGPSVYNPNIYDLSKNGRFNIPTYWVGTMGSSGIYHDINAVFVGDSTNKFSDWYFIEPQTDGQAIPGSWSMGLNVPVEIWKEMYLYASNLQVMKHSTQNLVKFNLNNGNGNINYVHPYLLTTRKWVPLNPTNEVVPSDTSIFLGQSVNPQNTGNVYNISDGADVFYSDSLVNYGNGNSRIYRTFSWKPFHHYIDSAAPTTLLKEYPWSWLNVDSLGTQIIDVMDNQAPVVSVVSPIYSVPYPATNIPFPQFSVVDNSGLPVNINYIGDSLTQEANGCGQFNYEQWLKYEFSDLAGNVTTKTFKNAEIYKPNESLEFSYVPSPDTTVGKWFEVIPSNLENFVKAEDNLYPQNNLSFVYTPSLINSSSTEKRYNVSVNVSGDCGCSRDTSFVLVHDLVNSVSDQAISSLAGVFPNPTTGVQSISFQGLLPGRVGFTLSTIQGRVLEQWSSQVEAGGHHHLLLDLSAYAGGVYLLRVQQDDNRVYTLRLVRAMTR